LRNEGGLLPLPKKTKRVALIGSHMKLPVISGGGSAVLQPYYTRTLYEALSERYREAGTEFDYEVGAPAYKMLPVLNKLIQQPDRSSIGGVMRFYNSPVGTAERQCVAEEHFLTAYCQLMDYKHPKLNFELFYITAEAIFTPDESGLWEFGLSVYGTANVYLDDELIIDETTEKQKAGGAFFGKGTPEKKGARQLEGGKEYKIRIEFGSSATSTSPQIGVTTFGGGGFQVGAARKVDPKESIDRACKLASEADYAVLCTGLNAEWECEGMDREMYGLPPGVDELISRVLAAQSNTVVVTQSGTPFAMPWEGQAKTLVHAWYGGNEAGNGIADVLFGDHNPSGRLPLSWPRTIKNNPAYLNWGSTQGRVLYGEDIFVGYKFYDELERPPMFSFGHGLSYTTFEMAPTKVSREAVTVEVRNTGKVAGEETVQVYVSAKTSAIRRPKRELQGFAKVQVEPGMTETVTVTIDKYAGSIWDESEERWLCEKGVFEVSVSKSSREEDLVRAGTFEIEETTFWLGL
jgi:beta-glucosidase